MCSDIDTEINVTGSEKTRLVGEKNENWVSNNSLKYI